MLFTELLVNTMHFGDGLGRKAAFAQTINVAAILQKSFPTHAKAMISAFSVLVLHPRDIRPSMAGINDHLYL